MLYRWIQTEVGYLELALNQKGKLAYIAFVDQPREETIHKEAHYSGDLTAINIAEKEITSYLQGGKPNFLNLLPHLYIQGTPFQQQCWQALLSIPYGKTITYQQQANLINNPKAVRAVGGANGRNRFPVVIPCHRVVGANGSLTGYAAGTERKQFLLNLELD